MRRHGLPLKKRPNQGHTILPMEHHPPEFVICTGTYLSAASTALRHKRTLPLLSSDGLDRDIFVFDELENPVHTTHTRVVLFLFCIRSFPFSRQTTLVERVRWND